MHFYSSYTLSQITFSFFFFSLIFVPFFLFSIFFCTKFLKLIQQQMHQQLQHKWMTHRHHLMWAKPAKIPHDFVCKKVCDRIRPRMFAQITNTIHFTLSISLYLSMWRHKSRVNANASAFAVNASRKKNIVCLNFGCWCRRCTCWQVKTFISLKTSSTSAKESTKSSFIRLLLSSASATFQ